MISICTSCGGALCLPDRRVLFVVESISAMFPECRDSEQGYHAKCRKCSRLEFEDGICGVTKQTRNEGVSE